MWNFFRLENEHLNNCGQFRVVRDISIHPIDLSEVVDDEQGLVRNIKRKASHLIGHTATDNGLRKRSLDPPTSTGMGTSPALENSSSYSSGTSPPIDIPSTLDSESSQEDSNGHEMHLETPL